MGLLHHDHFTFLYPHDVPFYYSPRSDRGWKGTRAQRSDHETSGLHGGYTSTASVSWWTKRRRWLHVPKGPLSPWISVVISKRIYKSDKPRQGTVFFLCKTFIYNDIFILFCGLNCVKDLLCTWPQSGLHNPYPLCNFQNGAYILQHVLVNEM